LKRLLYYSPHAHQFDRFFEELRRIPDVRVLEAGINPRVEFEDVEISWITARDICSALDWLRAFYVNLLLIDVRNEPNGDGLESSIAETLALLDALDQTEDLEARYGFHRILVLLPNDDPEVADRFLVELGARGVSHAMRRRVAAGEERPEWHFAHRALDRALRLIESRTEGKRALCASGGGITGIYFELGALKCLDDCFSGDAVNTFDLYFGISAGAVVTGLLSVGYSVDEFMAAIASVPGGRIPSLNLRLLRFGNLNLPDLRRRLLSAGKSALRVVRDLLLARARPTFDALIFEYGDIIGPPFQSTQIERLLREVLTYPGSTNDFRHLVRPLFIGATDQDLRRHVLFGAKGTRHVEISRAIQASISVNPAFSSVPIEGRYYEDGAVTRTSNFSEAIRRGADLIFVIDPFVPYVSKQSGFANDRGSLYNIDQDIRTVSFTRFEQARNWVLRKHPEVSSYTFLPSNRLRRLLSVNPMDHRPYLQIWRGAYLSTLQRLEFLCHRLRGDLGSHGILVDLDRAQAVASRLQSTASPTFADFFPDGEVAIKCPPLCVEQRAEAGQPAHLASAAVG
jgi:predicted acylesterase/phospholipase RssA